VNDEAARQSRPASQRDPRRRQYHRRPPDDSRRYSIVRCHVCGRRCEREVEPAITREGEVVLPAVLERDVWNVVARNHLILDVCHRCWMLWPDAWKRFPEIGFGRDVVDVLEETA
jgi:hypothetical protein